MARGTRCHRRSGRARRDGLSGVRGSLDDPGSSELEVSFHDPGLPPVTPGDVLDAMERLGTGTSPSPSTLQSTGGHARVEAGRGQVVSSDDVGEGDEWYSCVGEEAAYFQAAAASCDAEAGSGVGGDEGTLVCVDDARLVGLRAQRLEMLFLCGAIGTCKSW